MRILVADDHPILLEALKEILRHADETTDVWTAGTVDQARALIDDRGLPDLALLDFSMPGMGDAAVLDDLRARYPGLKVAIISSSDDAGLATSLLRRGAAGFVPKTMAPDAMAHAVHLMAAGGRYVPDFAYTAAMDADRSRKSEAAGDAPVDRPFGLTARELEAVRELSLGQSNKQIARKLGVEEVTIKLHLRRAYRKMNAHSRAEAVRIALTNGIA